MGEPTLPDNKPAAFGHERKLSWPQVTPGVDPYVCSNVFWCRSAYVTRPTEVDPETLSFVDVSCWCFVPDAFLLVFDRLQGLLSARCTNRRFVEPKRVQYIVRAPFGPSFSYMNNFTPTVWPHARAWLLGGTRCYVLVLPGRRSAFRAGFWPDCYLESTEIGPPVGLRPAGEPISVLSR